MKYVIFKCDLKYSIEFWDESWILYKIRYNSVVKKVSVLREFIVANERTYLWRCLIGCDGHYRLCLTWRCKIGCRSLRVDQGMFLGDWLWLRLRVQLWRTNSISYVFVIRQRGIQRHRFGGWLLLSNPSPWDPVNIWFWVKMIRFHIGSSLEERSKATEKNRGFGFGFIFFIVGFGHGETETMIGRTWWSLRSRGGGWE